MRPCLAPYVRYAAACAFALGVLAALPAEAGVPRFGTPIPLNTDAASDSGSDRAPTVASDGAGTWIGAWASRSRAGDTPHIHLSRSIDDGETWRRASFPFSSFAGDQPDLASDGRGRWVVVWRSGSGIGIAYSPDGFEWFRPTVASGSTGPIRARASDEARTPQGSATRRSGFNTGPRVASDGGTAWVLVLQSTDPLGDTIGTDEDILFSRSFDDGATWTPRAALDPNAATDLRGDYFPVVAGDASGTWIAAWTSQDASGDTLGPSDVFVARSFDDAGTWTAPAPIDPGALDDEHYESFPEIATDGRGTWLVVWKSGRPIGNILVTSSRDDGATWSDPAPIDVDGTEGNDLRPVIASDGEGSWVVVWESRGDLLAAASHDDGSSWTIPRRVEPEEIDRGSDFQQAVAYGGGTWGVAWEAKDSGGPFGPDRDAMVAVPEPAPGSASAAALFALLALWVRRSQRRWFFEALRKNGQIVAACGESAPILTVS